MKKKQPLSLLASSTIVLIAHVEPFTVVGYLKNALDSKVWGFSLLYMFTTTNTYAIAYFLPIILRDGMGFSVAKAQCLTAPPYVAAAIVMFIQAAVADKWRIRGPIIVFNALMGIDLRSHISSSSLLTHNRCPRTRPFRLSEESSRPLFRSLYCHYSL